MLNQDAEVENLKSSEKKTVKKDEIITFSDETPYLIHMADKVPLLLVPVDGSRTEIQVQGYPLADLVTIHSQKEIDQFLSNILVEIGTIQNLSRKRQFDLALQKLAEIQGRYPNVTSFNFIKASLLFLSGKKADSEFVLREALKSHPNNIEGKKLLEEITRN